MKIKTTNNFGHYSEETQPNPLLWMLLKQIGPEEYENVTNKLKCKDFFNDVAVTLETGKSISVYGFTTQALGLTYGKPISLLLFNTTINLENNLQVFNAYLESNKLPTLEYKLVKEGLLLTVDPWYWKNTYRTSLLTLIVRLLNVETKFQTFDEVVKHKQFASKDQQKWDAVVKKGMFFHLPEKYNKYSWYAGAAYNSEVMKDVQAYGHIIHNNGVLSWGEYLK